jgi:hypothetical protein
MVKVSTDALLWTRPGTKRSRVIIWKLEVKEKEAYPVLVRKQVDPLISIILKSLKYILLKSSFVKYWRVGAARGPCLCQGTCYNNVFL